jgi:hypothetical protein
MDIELPPHIVVRQLFRKQRACKAMFMEWLNEAVKTEWAGQRPRRDSLARFAADLRAQMLDAGGFNLADRGSPQTLKLKTETAYKTHCQVLWPVSFGRNPGAVSAYTEQGLMVSQLGGRISKNKTAIYVSPLLLCWTKHALERICERGGVETNLFEALTSSMSELENNLSIALAFGLAKKDESGDQWSRTAWIPYRKGLVVINCRAATASSLTRQMGWRLDLSKSIFSNLFVKKSKIVNVVDGDTGKDITQGRVSAEGWFVTTFISKVMMSSQQQSYHKEFEHLSDALPCEVAKDLRTMTFDPHYGLGTIEISDQLITDDVQEAVSKLKNMVASNSFIAETRPPMAHILDGEIDTAAYLRAIALL